MPAFGQLFVAGAGARVAGMALERLAFCLRKRAERETDVYFPSLSSRTLVYKGMLTTEQLDQFFPDLRRRAGRLRARRRALPVLDQHVPELAAGAPVPVHRPQRRDQHRHGQPQLDAGPRGAARLRPDPRRPGAGCLPICTPGASDSASFDEVLELLHMGGRSLPHAVLMMIPEAWENHAEMDAERRAFYEFHSSLMEPWDGPACVVFTDGTQIGAVLDRNGLRPSRYWVTDDGLVVLASEVGVLDIDPATIVRKGRLQPGRMFLVDTDEHRIIEDDEIKAELAAEHPYDEWLHAGLIHLDDLPEREHVVHTHASVTRRQQIFGYTEEELRILLTPMAQHRRRAARLDGHRHPDRGAVATSRGCCSTTSASCSRRSPTRRWTRSARSSSPRSPAPSARRPTCSSRRPASCRQVVLPFPVIDNDELAKILHINRDGDLPGFVTHVVPRPVRRRGRRRGAGARGSTRSAPRSPRRSPAAPASSCCPTGTPPPSWRRSRRCCSPARSTTTWSARRPAPRSGCWSRPATSARCTTSRC